MGDDLPEPGPDPSVPGGPGSAHRAGGDSAATARAAFASNGAADAMPAGLRLAELAEQAWQGGLDGLSDDELIGMLRAAHRMAARAAALELSAVADLSRRRREATAASGDPQAGEHVDDEVAAALTLTSCAAAHLQDLARGVDRLPGVLAALRTGRIDQRKAAVIAAETSALGDIEAAAVAAVVIRDAAGQTTSQLRAATRLMVLYLDPSAARRRKEAAQREARVELWHEPAGTCALAGRDLPPAYTVAADKYLAAAARWLKSQGCEGTTGQLRAAIYLALLTGQTLESLLPGHPGPPAGYPATSPGSPGSAAVYPSPAVMYPSAAAGYPAPAATCRGPDGPAKSGQETPGPGLAGPGLAGTVLAGSVQLTMPLTAWLGQREAPGLVPGFGPLDAVDSRALAAMLARHPATRWCLTLTDSAGRPVGHGCASGPPGTGPPSARPPSTGPPSTGPPSTGPPSRAWSVPGPAASWLAGLVIEPLITWPCEHAGQVASYRPSRRLGHLAQVRHPTCAHPGCNWPADRCDLDHARPYHYGGPTCLCNLYPRCRRHHRCKQAPGWRLTSASGEPILITPAGRSYPTRPARYPV